MDSLNQVEFLDEIAYISHYANALWKLIESTILLLAIVDQIGYFNLGLTTSLGERKL